MYIRVKTTPNSPRKSVQIVESTRYGDKKIDPIKRIVFEKTQRLFPGGVNLLLFDVTTLYFESTETDELRQFGYSKDHRFNTTQLVLALATNSEGLPVGYELFEGNKAEVKTLIVAIESWKALFHIGSVCFVGDRAMMSKNNLALLEEHGHQYIIAAKLRSLPKKLKNSILNQEHYRTMALGSHFSWVVVPKFHNLLFFMRVSFSLPPKTVMHPLVQLSNSLDCVLPDSSHAILPVCVYFS